MVKKISKVKETRGRMTRFYSARLKELTAFQSCGNVVMVDQLCQRQLITQVRDINITDS